MSSDGVGLYLRSLQDRHPLDHPTVVALATAVRRGQAAQRRVDQGSAEEGDQLAAERGRQATRDLYESNLRLVVSIARTYPPHPGSELADLIQAGNLGLWRAVELYDPDKGFRFSTYATKWIRQSIGRHLDKTSSALHLPIEVVSQLRAALREVGGDGTALPEEMKQFERGFRTASIDVPVGEVGTMLADLVPSHDEAVEDLALGDLARSALLTLVDELGDPHSTVVTMRFGLGGAPSLANTHIALALGCPRSTVQTILDEAIGQLRSSSGAADLVGAAWVGLRAS